MLLRQDKIGKANEEGTQNSDPTEVNDPIKQKLLAVKHAFEFEITLRLLKVIKVGLIVDGQMSRTKTEVSCVGIQTSS